MMDDDFKAKLISNIKNKSFFSFRLTVEIVVILFLFLSFIIKIATEIFLLCKKYI